MQHHNGNGIISIVEDLQKSLEEQKKIPLTSPIVKVKNNPAQQNAGSFFCAVIASALTLMD
jgi:hypothetical protein